MSDLGIALQKIEAGLNDAKNFIINTIEPVVVDGAEAAAQAFYNSLKSEVPALLSQGLSAVVALATGGVAAAGADAAADVAVDSAAALTALKNAGAAADKAAQAAIAAQDPATTVQAAS